MGLYVGAGLVGAVLVGAVLDECDFEQLDRLLAIQPGHPLATAAGGSWYPLVSRPWQH